MFNLGNKVFKPIQLSLQRKTSSKLAIKIFREAMNKAQISK